jgi:hypothetical protein
MTTLRQIAQNPRKALSDLEKDLGVGPGSLIREMDHFAEDAGDWADHLPYGLAGQYYDAPKIRAVYATHVDGCSTCQRLLETLHPSDLQAADFAQTAVRAQPNGYASRSPWAPAAAVGSLATLGLGAVAFSLCGPELTTIARIPVERPALVQELRTQPTVLVRLENSDKPVERYQAARVYFAADKPNLAWQQIGQGLELAGITPITVRRITNAATVPSDESAAALTMAAQRLHSLQTKLGTGVPVQDPTLYLEKAEVQAKLGLNADALKSIQAYLRAANVDPKALADFSKGAVSKSPNLLAVDTSVTYP